MTGLHTIGGREPAAFTDDTEPTRLDDGTWSTQVSDRWGVLGNVPNGGYTTALVLRAIAEQLPEQPDPASVTTHYLRPPAPGPAQVQVEVLRHGRTFTRVRASLWQRDERCCEVLAAMTDLPSLSGPTTVRAAPPRLPDRASCVDPSRTTAGHHPGIRDRLDLRVPPGAVSWTGAEPSGAGEVAAWVRWAGAEPMTAIGLVVIADSLPPAVFDLGGDVGWVPTVELTVQVRARPVPGWLQVRLRTRAMTDGMLEEDGEVWDAAGNLVALSRQLALAARPPT